MTSLKDNLVIYLLGGSSSSILHLLESVGEDMDEDSEVMDILIDYLIIPL